MSLGWRCDAKPDRVFGSDAFKASCCCGWRGPKRDQGPMAWRLEAARRDALEHMGARLFGEQPPWVEGARA